MLGEDRLRCLIDAGRALVAERELEVVLDRLLAVARELTGARFAAIGVLDERREGLADFITAGIDPEARRAIGELPRGRGVLGLLIARPRPVRLADVSAHPLSYGFPADHPQMRTFLGVPILIGSQAWGNLYLTEKRDGVQFDQADEQAAVVLAGWAAIAVQNAHEYRQSEQRRLALERSLRAIEATSEIAQAVGGETELDRVLELIAKRSRGLVDASAIAIVLIDGDQFTVAATAGQIPRRIVGRRLAREGSVAARVIAGGRPERVDDLAAQLHFGLREHDVQARAGLFVPLRFRGADLGVIEAFDRLDGPEFRAEDERLLAAAAASAATAVATARSVERERLRRSLQGAEQERRRSARELHDQTLQGLGALRVQLGAARRKADLAFWQRTADTAIEQIEQEIANLRAIITDLRPPALDEIGLTAALGALIDRTRNLHDLAIEATLELAENEYSTDRLDRERESVAYRVVQEALNNAATHAHAQRIEVHLTQQNDTLQITIRDDGTGFDPDSPHTGFGLTGMRERLALVAGQLEITSSPQGTNIHAAIPSRHRLTHIA